MVVIGRKKTKKCKESELIFLSDLNIQQEWKIVRAQNKIECDNNKTKSMKNKYLEWKNSKN